MMTTMATDSDAPISHPFSTITAATEAQMKEIDMMANRLTTMFSVASKRMIKASVTLIMIPVIAFLKKAFSLSILAQKWSAV